MGPSSGISGEYVREAENEWAQLKVKLLPNNQVKVEGISLWGTKSQPSRPNSGLLNFEATLSDRRSVSYNHKVTEQEEYGLELVFRGDSVIANEQFVSGYFGMNVMFGGEYRRII